jgi:hypothetical protein
MRRAGQRLTSFVSTSVSQTCGLTLWSLQVYADRRTMPKRLIFPRIRGNRYVIGSA